MTANEIKLLGAAMDLLNNDDLEGGIEVLKLVDTGLTDVEYNLALEGERETGLSIMRAFTTVCLLAEPEEAFDDMDTSVN